MQSVMVSDVRAWLCRAVCMSPAHAAHGPPDGGIMNKRFKRGSIPAEVCRPTPRYNVPNMSRQDVFAVVLEDKNVSVPRASEHRAGLRGEFQFRSLRNYVAHQPCL